MTGTRSVLKHSPDALCIDIVLATYNGELYLKEQIESIQNNKGYKQLVNTFIIVDDGSSDLTEAIVATAAKTDSKIKWIPSSGQSLGPSGNFCRGIELTAAPFVMLCDQDDIWFEDKISVSLESVMPYSDSTVPVLAYSEMHIVDNRCNLISDSYFKFKKIPLSWPMKWEQLLQQNTVSGCTSIFNRALVDKSLPIPEDAYMHDWWLALVAKQFGELIFIEKPLIAYRQHQNNTIGVKKRSIRNVREQFKRFETSVVDIIKQANAFMYRFDDEMRASGKTVDLTFLSVLARIPQASLKTKLLAFKAGLLKRSHLLGTLLLFVVVVFRL
ncbi:TPA: glycosyltransferase [Vibrio vulnificus]|uniref:L-Rha 1,3-L-rhamnosyltransferase n=2 Tax=Vibrio vulnificus TaxID=672 RepID=A0A2S3R5X9_VIBVL|nr:L-Rha 1,3-L-rhamnosyltransferase [Vibrio vulnificus]RAH30971.1 glycosyltransferase family 2 protein [Vibrio vulnificus]HAS6051794.1 glycosyltransferase [Vibrio vulnificus]HAS6321191.1 glycosyltransferase [Vibrio vulnificus]HAV6897443.1 glycosyltransferase [Vibrio vulnificus]